MCGIVGYIGKKLALPVLINGLYNLEYRGYDSAGIAVIKDSKLHYMKCPGKVDALARSIVGNFTDSEIGIAHTRWATHGIPSMENAHPHLDCSEKIAVVHNGIVENYYSLREKLELLGHYFKSETDTEVISHLIEERLKTSENFKAAVRAALVEIEGTYGIAVIYAEEPDMLVAARNGSPLLIGIGKDQSLVASDIAALVPYVSKIIHLSDGEVAFITRERVDIKTLHNIEVEKDLEEMTLESSEVRKGDYAHFMQKEIFEQPASLTNVMRGRLSESEDTIKLGGMYQVTPKILAARRIILTGCGTSWHSALYGKYVLEKHLGIPVEVEYASEFRYRDPAVDARDVVVAITQSGETADTLAALREAKSKGATCLAICNVVGSSVARESDAGIFIHAGTEIGVASTKAFTSQLVALVLFAFSIVKARSLEFGKWIAISKELYKLPELVSEVLQLDPLVKEIAGSFFDARNFLYLGRGYNFPVALEGALKLKEISYIHAEGYPAAEMKHGPIALIDSEMPVVFIAPHDKTYNKILSNIEEVKARGARIIAIVNDDDQQIRESTEYTIRVPKTIDILNPILSVIPLQLLAYHIALLRGCDVDQPRNLAKSVTVE
ncbi:MAG: glutamine--fructose-6-phosphate transaminase (isomerizing) [Candidatus Kryptoniota bacterium]